MAQPCLVAVLADAVWLDLTAIGGLEAWAAGVHHGVLHHRQQRILRRCGHCRLRCGLRSPCARQLDHLPHSFPRQPRSADDPWDWAEVRGRVVETVDGREAREHIDKLSRKYVGTDYGMPVGPDGRIILKIAADKVNTPKTLGRR